MRMTVPRRTDATGRAGAVAAIEFARTAIHAHGRSDDSARPSSLRFELPTTSSEPVSARLLDSQGQRARRARRKSASGPMRQGRSGGSWSMSR